MNTNLLDLHDGRRLCWAEYGASDGEPLFLFHGNPGSRLCWGVWPGLESLSGARLVAPDRPGYGRSEFTRSPLQTWPDDVVQLANHLGIDRFAIFAASGGAPYALACAWKIPDRLTAVGLFGAVGPNAPEAVAGALRSLKLLWRIAKPLQPLVRLQMRLMAGIARRDPARLVSALRKLELRGADRWVVDRPEIVNLFRVDFPEAYRQNGIGSAYDATVPASWPIPLDEVCMPVTLWHAERDSLTGNMTRYLADQLPNAELRIAGQGHLWIFDHLPELLRTLLAFPVGSTPHCADPNARDDSNGATALHQAAWDGDRERVDLLIRHGADVGPRDRTYNATPVGRANEAARTHRGLPRAARVRR